MHLNCPYDGIQSSLTWRKGSPHLPLKNRQVTAFLKWMYLFDTAKWFLLSIPCHDFKITTVSLKLWNYWYKVWVIKGKVGTGFNFQNNTNVCLTSRTQKENLLFDVLSECNP